MAEVYCGSEPCPLFLNSTCVFYTGESLLYIGVQTNDTLEAIIVKINQAFQNTGIGYAFTNGVIQPTPSQPVQLGGALIQNTTIGGNFTLTFSGNVQAAKHITTGGSSSQFVKGDGTLDSTAYQPAANYITGLSGDVLASGPGVAAATLATVNFSSGTFGNGNTIPIVTVNSKGLVTNITPTPINLPPISLTFIGDVVGSGLTGSNITLLLQNVNPNPYNTITPLKFSVNGKGLVTSASPITASDIVNILGYYPGSAGTSGTSGTSGIDGTFLGSSGTSGTSGSSATSGTSGTSGSSGTSGTSGSTGTSGSSGTTGTSGSSGTTGTSGSSGTSGTTGTSGSSGTSGTTGTSGSSGLSGDRFKTTSTTTYTLQAPGNPGTITVDPGLAYTVAQSIIIAFDANNHNEAEVTSYNSITGVINFVTFTLTGSGTYSSWFINIDGASGGDGTSGTSGTTGTSGSSGTSGTTGTSGSSGTSGTTGTSGSSGTSGTSATNGTGGTSGTSGTSGSSGTSGTTGTSGTSSTSGTSGTSGVTGLTALNGLTAQVQNFATGTSGTDFAISSSVSTHTFNLPTASATNRGALSSADWTTFNNKTSNVGTVTSVAALTLGTSGTDLSSTVANGTTTPVITLNVPDASATARGVVTTGTQTFAGIKNFSSTIVVNQDLQLAATGTASTTFIKNINGAGLTSIGSNGFGFNNSDNIYFSGSNKAGGVFAFNNTGNRTYTLQDASGTLAFTSQIPANPVGGTGAAGRVAYWNGSGTITSDSLFQWNDTFRRLGIGCTPTVSLDVVGAGVFTTSLTSQQSNISADGAGVVLQGYVDNSLRIAVRGSGYNSGARGGLLASTGDFSGALNGTSASFSGLLTAIPTATTLVRAATFGNTSTNALSAASIGFNLGGGDFGAIEVGYNTNSPYMDFKVGASLTQSLRIASTGAATFSSSVTANSSVTSTTAFGGTFKASDGTNEVRFGSYFNTIGAGNSYDGVIYTTSASSGLFILTGGSTTPKMTITSSGNVGIGTASPGYRFTVGIDAETSTLQTYTNGTSGANQGAVIRSWTYSTENYRRYTDIVSIGNWDGTNGTSAMRFFTQGNSTTPEERMRITSGGSIIATGTFTSSTAFSLQAAGQNGVSDGPYFRYLNTSNSYQILKQINANTDEDTWSIRGGAWNKIGTLNASTGVYTALSDINKKKDFEDSQIGLDAILGLKPTLYRMIDDESEGKKELGFIAQEVKEFIPQAYVENGDDEYQFVGLNYNAIVAALVKSVQELKTEIDSLKNQMQ